MILYLDTSSIVKMYVTEPGTDQVLELVERAAVVVTSRVAYAEARAAFARRRRERVLTAPAFAKIKAAFESDWRHYVVVDVTPAIGHTAGDLAERYALRGFDSLHLASLAHVLAGAEDAPVLFSGFDSQWNAAAAALTRSRRTAK